MVSLCYQHGSRAIVTYVGGGFVGNKRCEQKMKLLGTSAPFPRKVRHSRK